jgi:hypothetical protein
MGLLAKLIGWINNQKLNESYQFVIYDLYRLHISHLICNGGITFWILSLRYNLIYKSCESFP